MNLPLRLSWWWILMGCACLVGGSVAVRAEDVRDPFTFGPRLKAMEPSESVLLGVVWDATTPLAMIGKETLKPGDEILGWHIVTIQEDGIIIQHDERREFIPIGASLPAQ